MKEIVINNNIKMSQVVVGCMRMAETKMTRDKLLRFVENCMEIGATTFDHAPVYGGYTCEKLFGDAVLRVQPQLRSKMQIVTKTGIVLKGKDGNKTIRYESSKQEIQKEVEASLCNLGTDYIDLLLIHRPDILGNPQETADTLDQLVQEGKVLNVGVSNFMPLQIEVLQSYMKNPICINQVELSVRTTENFLNGVTDDALLRRIPLMAWSPLGGGNIFNGADEQSIRLREKLQEIAGEHQTSIDAIMYAWLFRHPVGIAAITGTMNIERVKKAVEALNITLSYDEWYQILEASRGYCVP